MNTKTCNKILAITAAITLGFLFVPVAQGAALTTLSDTMSRQAASTASNHTIKFTTPTGVAAGQTLTATFPAGFTMSSIVFGDVDLSWGATTGYETNDTAANALASTPSGATWGAVVAGQVLTITSGTSAIAAGNVVNIEIGTNATYGGTGTHQITNPTAGTYVVTLTAGPSDSGSVAVVTVTNDQVTMTASVDPSITFSLSANASAFGALSTGSVSTSSPNITLTIGTNANSGYTVSVADQGNGSVGGLFNSAATANIASASALLTAGAAEGYGIQASSGTATIAGPYNVSGNNVGQLQRTAQQLATYNTSTTSNQTVTVTHKATITASTKAGSYTDTLTYVATGNF